MEKNRQTYQVVIVGGGPAGIATAITLLAKGIQCCVVEAHTTPIRKSGEAIPPNAKPLLKQLGILSLVTNEKHKVYYGNKSCWGSDRLEQKEFIADKMGPGFLLDRLYFETQLQELYQNTKSSFYAGYKLRKVVSNENEVLTTIENASESITLSSNFIVDATGRKASVCRHLGFEKENLDAQFAITFNVKLTEGIPHEIIVEATENGWWYVAPYDENEVTMMFFTLKELIPAKEKIEAFLNYEIKHSIHLSSTFHHLTIKHIKILPAGTSCLQIPFGKNWLAVGDAAYSFDPISSYGITSALASGFYGGHAVSDFLLGNTQAFTVYRYIMEKAFQAYLHKLMAQYDLEKRWEQSHYWNNRLVVFSKEIGH